MVGFSLGGMRSRRSRRLVFGDAGLCWAVVGNYAGLLLWGNYGELWTEVNKTGSKENGERLPPWSWRQLDALCRAGRQPVVGDEADC